MNGGTAGLLLRSGLSLLLQYKGTDVPVFTIPPDWSQSPRLRMMGRTLVHESLDCSEERLQTRPRPLYGLAYTPLTMTEQETGYMRRVIELPDGLPFALPMWQEKVATTANVSAGALTIAVESTDDSLWDTFNDLAIIWRAFDDWELVRVDSVSTNTITLEAPVVDAWDQGTGDTTVWVIPVAFGTLKRNETTNITSDHAKFAVDFEERYFTVDIQASASSGLSNCCQSVAQYFAPAYSIDQDRIGVVRAGATPNELSDAIFRIVSPDCDGVLEIESFRPSGGATYYPDGDKFYCGIQGGEDGAFGDALAMSVSASDGEALGVHAFPNESGVGRGLDCQWIEDVARIWMQVRGSLENAGFAVIDPADNDSFILVDDELLTGGIDNAWVYCPFNQCIYVCGRLGVLAKIDCNTLVVTEIDLSELGTVNRAVTGITYTAPEPGNDGSGMIWLSYHVGSAYGIALIDPSSDTIEGGFPTDVQHSSLWYAGAFDLILAGVADDYFYVYHSNTGTAFQQIDGFQLTGRGTYVDSEAKIVVPTLTDGQYCLTYFSTTVSGLSADGPFGFVTETDIPFVEEDGDSLITED